MFAYTTRIAGLVSLLFFSCLVHSGLPENLDNIPVDNQIRCSEQTDLAALIKPYAVSYDTEYNGVSIDNLRELVMDAPGVYSIKGKMSLWFIEISEYSRFETTNHPYVRPLEYSYLRHGLSGSKDLHLLFDWHKDMVKNNIKGDNWTLAVEPKMQDMLSHQIQFRLDLICDKTPRMAYDYWIAKKKRVRHYIYDFMGEETISTPLGRLNTLHFKKQDKDGERKTLVWLAKDWDYLIVKLSYQEKGESSHQLVIKKGTLGNRRIFGL
jgi:hypothetical protein